MLVSFRGGGSSGSGGDVCFRGESNTCKKSLHHLYLIEIKLKRVFSLKLSVSQLTECRLSFEMSSSNDQ